MTKLDLLVLCDQALISRENKLSIIGIFDQITVQKLPSSQLKMTIVGVLSGDPNSDSTFTLQITDPAGQALLPSAQAQVHFGPNGRSNLITELANFPLPTTGQYTIQLSSGNQALGDYTFIVLTAPTPSSTILPN